MNESNTPEQTAQEMLTDTSGLPSNSAEIKLTQQHTTHPNITKATPLLMNPDKFLALEWMQESIKMVIDHSVIMMSKDLPSHADLDSVIADLKQLIGAFNVTRLDELLLLCEVLVQIVSSIANQQLSMQVCSEVIVGLDVLDTELDKILQNKREQSIAIYRTLSYLKTYLHDTNQNTILSKLELKEQDIVNVMMHEDYELKPHSAETREMLLRAYRHLLCKLFDGEQTENIYSGLFKVLSTLLLGAKTLHEAAILRVGCILHDAVLLHALAYNHATRQLFIRLERTLSNDLSDTTLLADMLDLFAKANVYTNGAAVLRKMFGLSIPEKAVRSPGILQAASRLIKHARKLPADKYPEAIYNLQEAHRLLDLAGWTSLAKEASRCALKLESYAVSNTSISTTTNSEPLQIDNRITQALLDLESMIGHMVNVTTQITHNALQATHVSAIYELQTLMAQIKRDFSSYSLTSQISTLKTSAQKLKNIQTSLSNWQLDEASELTERLNIALDNTVFKTGFTPTQRYLNAIAEALVLLEQYLAHLATQQQNNNALQALEQLLAQFETLATATEEPAEAVTGEKIYDDFTATSNKDDLDLDVSPPNAFALATIDSDIDTALSALNIPKDNIEDSDPEITHIFIEELHDVLAVLQKSYTNWVLALDNLDILTSVRRSFHTLKGSGRMVGAKVLGELCWSIERMLNKALDNNLTPSLAMANLVEQVVQILPPLTEAFTQQVDASNGVKHYIYAANQIMQKQPINNDLILKYTRHYWSANTVSNPTIAIDDTSTKSTPDVIEPTVTAHGNELELTPSHQPQITDHTALTANKIATIDETGPTPLNTVSNSATETHQELDTQILNIFLTESSDYLNTITSSFNQIEHETDVTDALSAALHTLRGSAGMLDIAPVYQLASAMESLCLKYKQHKQPLPVGHLALLHLAQTRITTYVNALYTGKKSQLTTEDEHLLAQLHHLTETDFTGENLPQSTATNPINTLIALDIDTLLDADVDLPSALTTTAPEAYIQTLYVQLKSLENTAITLMLPEIAQLSAQLAAVYNRYLECNSTHTTTLPLATLVQAHATLLSLFDDVAAHQTLQIPEDCLAGLAAWLAVSIEQEKVTNGASVPHQGQAPHSTVSIQQAPDFSITQTKQSVIDAKAVHNIDADASIDIALDNTQETTEQTSLQDNAISILDSNANTLTATAITAKVTPNTTESALKNTHIVNTTDQSKDNPLPQQASGISLMQSEAFFNTGITATPTTETLSVQHGTTPHKDNNVAQIASDAVAIQSVTQKIAENSIAPITTSASSTIELTTSAIQPETSTVVSGSTMVLEEAPTIVKNKTTQPHGFYEPIDTEMGDIFLEEANEILETMNIALDQWQQTQSITPLRELQRQLHTLKGNARMVGLTTFAQMCHELETLYDRQARMDQSSALILRLFNHIHHQIGAELTYLQTHQQLFDCTADIKLLQQYHATLDDSVLVQFFEQLKSNFTQTITALSDDNILKMLQDTKQDAKVIANNTQTNQVIHTSHTATTRIVDTENKNPTIDQIESVTTDLEQEINSEAIDSKVIDDVAIDGVAINSNATNTTKESTDFTTKHDFFATLPTIEIPIANPALAHPHTTPIQAMDDLNVSLIPDNDVTASNDTTAIEGTDPTSNLISNVTSDVTVDGTADLNANVITNTKSTPTLLETHKPSSNIADSVLPKTLIKETIAITEADETTNAIADTQPSVEQTPASATPHFASIPTAIPAPIPTSNIELLAEQWDIEQTTQDHTQDIFLEEAATLISNCSQNWQSILLRLHADTIPQGEILAQPYTELIRQMHTLKGSARIAGFTLLGDIAYQLELRFKTLSLAKTSTQADLLQETATIDYAFEWLTSAIRQLDQGLALESPDALLHAFAIENNVEPSSQTTAPADKASTVITPAIEPLPLAMSTAPQTNSSTTLPTATINTVKNIEPAVTLQAGSNVDSSLDNQASIGINSIHPVEATDHLSASETKPLPTEPPPMEGLFTITTSEEAAKEVVRVPSLLLEKLINLSGEDSVYRTRVEMQVGQLTSSLTEMGSAIGRIVEQLRRMEGELEIQIRSRHEKELEIDAAFDPLEMDQYSALNQLSKSLSESASDLQDFKGTLSRTCHDSAVLLHQQSRIQTEIQDQLMSSRLVPFSRILPRLQRLVRQLATELDKKASLNVINPEGLLDRVMLERLVVPLEHMLRNALDHGVETPEQRIAHGKPDMAVLSLSIEHKGGNVHICLKDDGQGIDVDAVKAKAISNGLLDPKLKLSQQSTLQLIFQPGLSTAEQLSQISGRGVGMDIVLAEIKQLGGDVSVDSIQGQGASFTLTLPLTVALTDVLKVKVGKQTYAVPLSQIEKIITLPSKKLLAHYQSGDTTLMIENTAYHVRPLADAVQVVMDAATFEQYKQLPLLVVKNAGESAALQVDQLVGSRSQIVVKPIGQQLAYVKGIAGATIEGNGTVVLVLDTPALTRQLLTHDKHFNPEQHLTQQQQRKTVLVVDDSVTVRKVTTRILERAGFNAITAFDGVDALETLETTNPDIMILDIEMPRMDGFELATRIKRIHHLTHIPLVMITSRTGEKHREKAFQCGVDCYMGKPFKEAELLQTIHELLESSAAEI